MEANSLYVEFTIQRLRSVRGIMLRLHKELLETERVVYEQFHGRIQSKGEFFRLVLEHEWFSWLRCISQFIVQIDETLSAKQAVTLEQANQLLEEARKLLLSLQEGSGIQKRYSSAIQRNPDVALLHEELSKLLMSDA